MASPARRSQRSTNIWPGFVDALATLLMVIIFLLMIFVLAQFFLSEALSGRDAALQKLHDQVSELAEILSLERSTSEELRLNVAQLSEQLQATVSRADDLNAMVEALTLRAEGAEEKVATLTKSLDETTKIIEADRQIIEADRNIIEENKKLIAEYKKTIEVDREKIAIKVSQIIALSRSVEALKALKEELESKITSISGELQESNTSLFEEREISDSARAQVALLNQQMAALRQQLAQLSSTLKAYEELAEDQKVQISSLGKRLNAALATKVQELSRYRSEFFGRLREVLGKQPGIQIVGDRFVFQSEVLFESASAEIGESGQAQLEQLANGLKEIALKIPPDINWILRIDGHTDQIPIFTAKFPSNWELSSARAISVVNFLIDQGIPPNRLAAAGFAEYQPLDPRGDEIAYRRNRRIELKLTQR